MKIKKYVVEDVKDALRQIKSELGEDAVILQTRKFKKGGFLGLGSRLMYEVTAVAEEKRATESSSANPRENKEEWIDREKLYALKQILAKNTQKPQPYPSTRPSIPSIPQTQDNQPEPSSPGMRREDFSDREITQIRKDMMEMKRLITDMSTRVQSAQYLPNMPEEYRRIYEGLRKQEINEEVSKRILESLRIVVGEGVSNTYEYEKKFTELISPTIKTDHPISDIHKGDIIFFIGPTGVGKTTTLTKIAAMMSLEMRKRVGILTIDTYRIAAVDQLKTSADIMGIQVGVAYNPKELKQLLERFQNYDCILVDTAGRSQWNDLQMSELTSYLEVVRPQQTYLTFGMNMRMQDLFDVVERFSIASPTHLVLTKMDETNVYGSLVEISQLYDLPIAFVTNGQRIPEDIMVADSKRLGSMIVKEVLKYARSA